MNQIPKHREVMISIIKEFFQHPQLATQLGFKGGTSLYLFHDLDRFSVDLNFNLLEETDFQEEMVSSVLNKYLTVKDHAKKYNTLFWQGSYQKGRWNLKIEISTRDDNNKYEVLGLYGLSVPVMQLPYQFAHKLVAITDRKAMVNRDLYDTWWFFNQHIDVEEQVITKRLGLTTTEYMKKLIDYIPKHINQAGVLYNLGELLNNKQKAWVKEKLVDDLLFYLRSHIN